MRRTMIVTVLFVVAACSNDLSRKQAAGMIESHIAAVAPSIVHRDSVRAVISEILTPSDANREVRFSLIWPGTDSTGTAVADTGDILTAHFQRSDAGWALARYGESLRDDIASLLSYEWRSRFNELLDLHYQVNSQATAWELEVLDGAATRSATRYSFDLYDEYRSGIPERELRQRIEKAGLTVPDDLEWGIAGERGPDSKRVLFVRLAQDTSVVCARWIGSGDNWNPTYHWLDKYGTACRGYGLSYRGLNAHDDAMEAIIRAGGIVLTR